MAPASDRPHPGRNPGPSPARRKLWDHWDRLRGRKGRDLASKTRERGKPGLHPYVVAIINQKGGTGKTTTIYLGAALARLGYETLVVDLDPQGHTTIGLKVEAEAFVESMAEVMSIPRKPVAEIILPTSIPHLSVAPSPLHLATVAEQIYLRIFREAILAQALQGLPHDFILIDCPPSLGVLTLNALFAADFILIPRAKSPAFPWRVWLIC